MWAQVDIIISSIETEDLASAQAGIDNLFVQFSDSENLCDATHSIAYSYRQFGKNNKANELDRYVLDNWSATESAMWAQVDLLKSAIDSKDYISAQAGIEYLKEHFSNDVNSADIFHGVAYKYRKLQKEDAANKLDSYVIENYPTTESALWAQLDIIISSIEAGDFNVAQEGIDNLFINSPDNKYFGNALYSIADTYELAGNFAAANKIYRKIINNRVLETKKIAAAKAKLAKYDLFEAIEFRQKDKVAEIIENSDSNIPDCNQGLDIYLNNFAIECCAEGRLAKKADEPNLARDYFDAAITLWDKLLVECPNSPVCPKACFCAAAKLAQDIENYGKAVEYFQRVADDWADYKYAGWAQLKAGYYLEKIVKEGYLPAEATEPVIIDTYKAVIDNYPGSKWALKAKKVIENYE
jgi:tetratricopeptide (TPR) repeat protein